MMEFRYSKIGDTDSVMSLNNAYFVFFYECFKYFDLKLILIHFVEYPKRSDIFHARKSNDSIYFLFCCWFWAEFVSLDTTRVKARFSARRRSFSVLYFCSSYTMRKRVNLVSGSISYVLFRVLRVNSVYSGSLQTLMLDEYLCRLRANCPKSKGTN